MKYETKALVTEASQIKNFIEKNKKIPKAATLTTGETLSPYSIAYLLSLAVKDNLKTKSYDLVNVIIYNPAKKHVDTINNKDVSKKDYMIMIDNFLKFCRKYHRVPRYITVPSLDVKVSFELYLYCISKIVLFIDKNKKLPNYCNFNKSFSSNAQKVTSTVKKEVKKSTSTSKKEQNSSIFVSEGHCLKQGKDCLGQIDNVSCAIQALWELLRKFGIKVSKTQLKKWAGTTSAGTSHQGINTAIAMVNKKYNVHITVEWKNFSDLGKTSKERWKNLGKLLSQPNVGVLLHNLYRLKYGHYEDIWKILLDSSSTKTMNSLGVRNADGSFQGYIEDRSFKNWESYLKGISQPSVCILKFKK